MVLQDYVRLTEPFSTKTSARPLLLPGRSRHSPVAAAEVSAPHFEGGIYG